VTVHRRLGSAGLALFVAVACVGCGDDDSPPTRDEAVRAIEVACLSQLGQVEAVAAPESLTELEQSAGQAFGTMNATRQDLEEEGLDRVEEEPAVGRYLEAASTMMSAVSEVSLAAEDIDRIEAALARGETGADDLDEAAAELGLPDRCGAQMWGETLLAAAAYLAGAAEER
jgi:hypothetical protein